MTKYKVVNTYIVKSSYARYMNDEELQKAFEDGWEYVECNQFENWFQYILKKEVSQ